LDLDFVRREIEELRRMREELSLQARLGQMEARDLWAELEERFAGLEAQARRLTSETGEALEDLGDSILEAGRELRDGYERLRAKLAETVPGNGGTDDRRSVFGRLFAGGRRAAGQVVDSLGDLGDVARLRVRGARLERTRLKKCAEAGSRLHALAQERGVSDDAIARALGDALLKNLLGEIDSLDAEIRSIRSELDDYRA
jgi:hypothetical protein